MSHERECDEAWGWPDFMSGRGIEDSDCWMCGLLRQIREDERQRMAAKYLVSDREQEEAEHQAFTAGLQAARDAVAALRPDKWEGYAATQAALAAIDALRGEQ